LLVELFLGFEDLPDVQLVQALVCEVYAQLLKRIHQQHLKPINIQQPYIHNPPPNLLGHDLLRLHGNIQHHHQPPKQPLIQRLTQRIPNLPHLVDSKILRQRLPTQLNPIARQRIQQLLFTHIQQPTDMGKHLRVRDLALDLSDHFEVEVADVQD
jgi:hypothetical protein